MSSRIGFRFKVNFPQLILSISLFVSGLSLIITVNQSVSVQADEADSVQSVAPIQIEPVKTGQLTQSEDYDESHLPSRIVIPSLEIDLPVQKAAIVNGYWQVPTYSAAFGLGSSLPKDKGNSVVFAHSRSDLFAPLKKIKSGSRIYLLTSANAHIYEVTLIQEVDPDEVSVVSSTQTAQLTLYTCSGPMDSKRLVVIAKPID